jgi:hypothetical protein
MAMAVQRTYKETKVTIGPWIERGFYYDFDFKEPITEKELKKIQKEMQKIVRADLPFIREEVCVLRGTSPRRMHALQGRMVDGWCHPQPLSCEAWRALDATEHMTTGFMGFLCRSDSR